MKILIWFACFITLQYEHVECYAEQTNTDVVTPRIPLPTTPPSLRTEITQALPIVSTTETPRYQCNDSSEVGIERCLLCTRDGSYDVSNETRKNVKLSCYKHGYYHLFYYASSPVSILPPSNEGNGCYVDVCYEDGLLEDRLYISHDGEISSKYNKWELTKNSHTRNIRNIFRYKIRRTAVSGKSTNSYVTGNYH